ncbi:MAG TPA: phage tail sheath subtilisin-like domain-containing protein [Allocoleopsis sp.]
MLASYMNKAPGVYQQEVFLPLQSGLPTGVPGFVGFADAIAPLAALPTGLQFPDSLNSEIYYNADKGQLACRGVMTQDIRDELLALSSDPTFQQAVLFLYAIAQQQLFILYRKQDFANQSLSAPEPSNSYYLLDAINGFFENGGVQCYVVRADGISDREKALKDALNALIPIVDLDLVAIPDVMILQDQAAMLRVQQAALQHCAQLDNRMAILDAFPSLVNGQPNSLPIQSQRTQLIANQLEPINGALYFPWVQNTPQGRLVPPCGYIAGVIARSDRTRGVFKAPANEEILNIFDLEVQVDDAIQGELNPIGINCLRAFPGRGIRVWGARTLSQDINWRYINVRRIFLTLSRWIDRNMLWATFETNSPFLWVRIQRELSDYLETLWQAGALKGQTIDQAFYVKCDAQTNPPELRDRGQVAIEVGLAPNAAAEFIIVRIVHHIDAVGT